VELRRRARRSLVSTKGSEKRSWQALSAVALALILALDAINLGIGERLKLFGLI
jgi:hypothetical protein